LQEIADIIPDKSRFETLLRGLDVSSYSIRNPIVILKLRLGLGDC
jgi:hypothetical protein